MHTVTPPKINSILSWPHLSPPHYSLARAVENWEEEGGKVGPGTSAVAWRQMRFRHAREPRYGFK
jgi:hypothetical protein